MSQILAFFKQLVTEIIDMIISSVDKNLKMTLVKSLRKWQDSDLNFEGIGVLQSRDIAHWNFETEKLRAKTD